ncbi:MAG: PAS domain-containing protein [Bacteroidota bacterium]|nr:PAS domain-containing protein [Bacteroidota bacterium]
MDDPRIHAECMKEIARLRERLESSQQAARDLEDLLASATRELEKVKAELRESAAEQIRLRYEMDASMEKLRALTRNIPGFLYRCANDEYWTMEYMSDHVEELTGYPADDFIGNRVRSFVSIIHGDDVLRVAESVRNGLEKKEPYIIEYRIKHADGSMRWVWERGSGVFDNGGHFLYLEGVILDITDHIAGMHEIRWKDTASPEV